jgi:Helicase associated domain
VRRRRHEGAPAHDGDVGGGRGRCCCCEDARDDGGGDMASAVRTRPEEKTAETTTTRIQHPARPSSSVRVRQEEARLVPKLRPSSRRIGTAPPPPKLAFLVAVVTAALALQDPSRSRQLVVGTVRAFTIPAELSLLLHASRSSRGCFSPTTTMVALDHHRRSTRTRARERLGLSSLASSRPVPPAAHQRLSAALASAPASGPGGGAGRPAAQRQRQSRGGGNVNATVTTTTPTPADRTIVIRSTHTSDRKQRGRTKTKPTKPSSSSSSSSASSSSYPRTKWDRMVALLREFRRQHGHSFVSREVLPRRGPTNQSSSKEMKELLLWTRSVRSNYRHQVLELRRRKQQQQQQLVAGAGGEGEGEGRRRVDKTLHGTLEDREYLLGGGATPAASVLVAGDDPAAAGAAATPSFTTRPRPRLSRERLRQLLELDFVWDAQQHAWEAKYEQLVRFKERYGHCRVPNNSVEYPRLGVWVRNQRREHKKLMMLEQQQHRSLVPDEWSPAADTESGAPNSSTLTPERLRRLEALGFDWYKSHDDTWNDKYRQLQQYVQEFGHARVRQDDPEHLALGQWCMNQRVAYRKRMKRRSQEPEEEGSGNGGDGDELTLTRIQRLERVGFSWHVRDDAWQTMKQRLVDYYDAHGHVDIPTAPPAPNQAEPTHTGSRSVDDRKLELLRTWLNRQRHEYKRLKEGLPSPMTTERIHALERSIPNFSWQVRGLKSGPSTEDWAKLFDAMRAKGLKPGMRPKSHWFEGAHPFRLSGQAALAATKDVWTEQDLLALWNQESEQGEEEEEEEEDADLNLDLDLDGSGVR